MSRRDAYDVNFMLLWRLKMKYLIHFSAIYIAAAGDSLPIFYQAQPNTFMKMTTPSTSTSKLGISPPYGYFDIYYVRIILLY